VGNEVYSMSRPESERRSTPRHDSDDELAEFAGTVAHDIRNPLLVARGNLELVETDDERIDAAHLAIDRAEEILDDLLRYARDGEWTAASKPVELSQLTRAAWETVPTRDATLRVETDRVVSADPGRTRQLFENLIDNAVRHGGADVTVTVDDLSQRPGGRQPDDTGFVVEDDGPGIPPDRRERVFESGVSTAGGTGYGLAIVSRLAVEQGWTVAVTESDSGGARFEFTGVDPLVV
jgi:signal transduction histidine kinase